MTSGTQDQKVPAMQWVARPGRHRSCLFGYNPTITENQQNVNNYLFNKTIVRLIHVGAGLCADIVDLAKPKS
jgi:hypothetical protein